MKRRLLAALAALLVAAGAVLTPILNARPHSSTSAHADDSSSVCGTHPGKRQVVLLVHGFNSGPGTWSTRSRQYLASNPLRTCIVFFDYAQHSTDWVTSPEVGPALATTIKSLSSRSRDGGGTGKIVIVGHSMGGLAVRCAVAPVCSHTDGVADDIAALVTFGTPNLGTGLKGSGRSLVSDVLGPLLSADCQVNAIRFLQDPTKVCSIFRALGTSNAGHAFTPGSGELKALPPLSATSSFPVAAVAGQIHLITSFWTKHLTLGDAGDLVVNEDSALDEARQVNGIGGATTVNCGDVNVGLQAKGEEQCWHSDETNNPGFLTVALTTIAKIEQAVDSPPTVREVVNPFTASGGLQPGWHLDTSQTGSVNGSAIDCSYDQGSPYAVGAGTHACGATADSATACWTSTTSSQQIWCLDIGNPDSRALRVLYADQVNPNTPAPGDPVPLDVELSDGSQLTYHYGGAWGGRADQLWPAYGCVNHIGICGYQAKSPDYAEYNVLASPQESNVIDKSRPTWRVKVGLTGDPRIHYPAPRVMTVRKAWFIAGHQG